MIRRRQLSIRSKTLLFICGVLTSFGAFLVGTYWFLQRPSHHGLQLQTFLITGFVTFGVILVGMYWYIDRHVIRPLERLNRDIDTIAGGQVEEDIDVSQSADEIGQLSRATRDMHDQLLAHIHDAERFGAAIEHAGHAVYITDREGTITYVNPAFTTITGYSEAYAIGRNPRILNANKQSAAYYTELWETIQAGDVWEEEFINRRATGELFRADQTVAPIFDADGEIDGFVAIMADRTEERVQEQQTQVLSRVFRHNLRTELNLIEGYAYQLSQTEDAESRAAYIDMLQDRVDGLVSWGLKVDRSMREVQEGVFRQTREVHEACRAIRRKMEKRFADVEVQFDLPSTAVEVPIDIELVLEEIVENAIEHNDSTDPVVNISIEVSSENAPPPGVDITITDNGPGFPQAERIVLEEGNETPLTHGSGLGLWFTYWIVTLAGGEIAITEREPTGAVVSVHLPRASIDPSASMPESPVRN